MKTQRFEHKNEEIRKAFEQLKCDEPQRLRRRLAMSWSNWGFGLEPLEASAKRLAAAGLEYIELHGNHYGPDLGYDPRETLRILDDHGLKISGICGMYSAENELASNIPQKQQAAVEYIRRELEFGAELGAEYLLVVPAAVGRPVAHDDTELERSTATLRSIALLFEQSGIKAAVEPIRSAEVSIVHTIAEAKEYIRGVDHPAIAHINGDLYHMFTEEDHMGEAILSAGEQLVNLHAADSNRRALGDGFMDLDTIIMALYLIGYNTEGRFVTPEPLGPGGDPYPAKNSVQDPAMLDRLVQSSVEYFRERERSLVEA